MQHTVVATQLNVNRKYSGTQHDTETFGLPEGQVASTMISVLILSSTLTSQW